MIQKANQQMKKVIVNKETIVSQTCQMSVDIDL